VTDECDRGLAAVEQSLRHARGFADGDRLTIRHCLERNHSPQLLDPGGVRTGAGSAEIQSLEDRPLELRVGRGSDSHVLTGYVIPQHPAPTQRSEPL
jgi:hypothetical protein